MTGIRDAAELVAGIRAVHDRFGVKKLASADVSLG
jgi:hypothetical protein